MLQLTKFWWLVLIIGLVMVVETVGLWRYWQWQRTNVPLTGNNLTQQIRLGRAFALRVTLAGLLCILGLVLFHFSFLQ